MEGYGNENPGAFQPTRPLRGATVKLWHWIVRRNISTHAPLAGRDVLCECNPSAIIGNFNPRAPCGARRRMAFKHCGQKENFNPRAPCGARRSKFPSQGGKTVFQPTRPLRGATTRCRRTARRKCISTHAPLAGRDSKSVQITMHIFAITDKFQMLLHRMPPVRAFCSFLMQENHADFGCEPPK
mgnify:CR=1 FL=1